MIKKLPTFTCTVFALALSQTLALAQVFKYPLFEHFTQASCGPCATQNPGFQSSILDANPVSVHHISYHTSWPGVDPMNAHNPTDVANRVTYYNVGGVPSVTLLGNVKTAQPGGFSQADINNQVAAASPLKITVTEVDNGNNRDITVTLTNVGNLTSSGNDVLHLVVVERNINYVTAPGNNGEKHFPNVMRKMLPDANGTSITIPSAGMSSSHTFNVVEDAIWNNAEIASIAFVQNDNTKEIYNSGASWDPSVNVSLVAPPLIAQQGAVGLISTFNGVVGNTGTASEDFLFTLSSVNAPANWTASYKANGVTYTTPTSVTLTPGSTINADIEVTPGGTPGLAEYTLSITSVTNPLAPAMFYTVYVIEGVTTLLVNNSSGLGDGSGGSAANWSTDFVNGLNFANCSTYAICNEIVALKVADAGALNTLHKVFFNVGWTFPSLTDDLVAKFELLLNNGGRLFISGQDIGWETYDPAGSGTPNTQSFYTNYLGATYLNDGTTQANVALNFNASDVIYAGTPNSNLINYYGGTYFYPDELNATANGSVITYYGAGTAKKGAVRSTNGVYKTVYLGYGLEMVGSTAVKNEIIKRAYDWFDNLTSTEEFDAAMLALNIGQNFPNPANNQVTIPVNNLTKDATIQVTDFTGRMVMEQIVNKQSTQVHLNTNHLEAGLYSYRLCIEGKTTPAKTMQVIR